jgi:hypothetical protein
MKSIRSSMRVSAVLSITTIGAAAFGVSETAEAAKFPTQAYFWLDNHINPVNFVPWADYSMCKTHADHGCTIKVSENPNGNVGFYDLYDISVSVPRGWRGFSGDTLIFATAYGETASPRHPRYCTSGGTMLGDSVVNCSAPTNISVRLVGNDGVSNRWAVVGSAGNAGFGSYKSDNPITFNSDGNVNEVTEIRVNGVVQPGRYKVVVPFDETQSTVSSAIAQVQAIQPLYLNSYKQKRICTVHSLTKKSAQNARAAEMEVRCFGFNEEIVNVGMGNGSSAFFPVDTGFNYIYEHQDGFSTGLVRSVWSDRLVNGIYNPVNSSHSNISVQRIGTGRYTVHMPNTRATKTNVQLTAQGSGARWCNVLNWVSAGNGTDVKLACFVMTADGAIATDSRFFLGYYYEEDSI